MSQDDWQDSLANEISAGSVVVHENDRPWFDLLAHRFPVRASGICWEQLPSTQFCQAQASHIPAIDKANSIRVFFTQFGETAKLKAEDTCIVIGDNTTSIAIEVSYQVLLSILSKLVTEPQSLYVIAKNGDWCFAFTFEEDMYYAKSPH